jgi:DNA polymerase elongation subunit (family B)
MSKKEWKNNEIKFVLSQYQKGHSRYAIAKLFKSKFGYLRSPDSIKHCISTHGLEIEKDLPRVLVLDIETSPIVAFVWGLRDQTVPLNMVVKDWFVLSWTAKWIGEDKVFYKDQRSKKGKALENDKALLVPLLKLLNEADIVVTQNGNAFDLKKLNARFLEHGLDLPSPFKKIDTYLIAKKHFAFTSNKLEYMSKKFNKKYKKQDHADFSGFKLWEECLKGNLKAWKSMETYNNFDVLATEELFINLSKFEKTEVVRAAVLAYEKNKTL